MSLQKSRDPAFADGFEFGETFEEYNLDPWQDVQKYIKRKRLSCTDQKIAQVLDEGKHAVSTSKDCDQYSFLVFQGQNPCRIRNTFFQHMVKGARNIEYLKTFVMIKGNVAP